MYGSVMSWGDAASGGGCGVSVVRDQLRSLQQLQAAGDAFTALLRVALWRPGATLSARVTEGLLETSWRMGIL